MHAERNDEHNCLHLPAMQRVVLAVLLALISAALAQQRRIKVQHIAPFVGRHNGGLLLNVTGKGAQVSRTIHECWPILTQTLFAVTNRLLGLDQSKVPFRGDGGGGNGDFADARAVLHAGEHRLYT